MAGNGLTVHEQTYSWGEFVERSAGASANGNNSRSERSTAEWDLNVPFAPALQLAREGWHGGEDTARKLSASLVDLLSSRIEREYPVYEVEGAEIDVARYLDGEPECWQRMQPVITEGVGRRLVRIVYNVAASCGVDAQVQLAKGSAVVALIELLELAGNGVALDVVLATTVRPDQIAIRINVKNFDQPLDLSRVAYAVAHPAFFRRLGFSVMEQYPSELFRRFKYNYGMPDDITENKGDLYIGRSLYRESEWLSPETARAWVVSQLQAHGVVIQEEV